MCQPYVLRFCHFARLNIWMAHCRAPIGHSTVFPARITSEAAIHVRYNIGYQRSPTTKAHLVIVWPMRNYVSLAHFVVNKWSWLPKISKIC